MRSSTAAGSISPVTTGMIIASQATVRAASPSSQASPSPGPADAAARCPAQAGAEDARLSPSAKG